MTTKQANELSRLWEQGQREAELVSKLRTEQAAQARQRAEQEESTLAAQQAATQAVDQALQNRIAELDKEREQELTAIRDRRIYQETLESLTPEEQREFLLLHGESATLQRLAQQAVTESDRQYPISARAERLKARAKRELEAEQYSGVLRRTFASLDSEQQGILVGLLEAEPSNLEKIQQFKLSKVNLVGSLAALWQAGITAEQNNKR